MNDRRSFLKQMCSFLISPFIILSTNSRVDRKNKEYYLNHNIYRISGKHGIHNFDDIFIKLKDNDIGVYSNKCSYCGSRLIVVGENLLCCTHDSSKFNSNGIVLQGPANMALVPLRYQLNSETNIIVVFKNNNH